MESSSELPDERFDLGVAPPTARIVARAVDLVMIVVVAILIGGALTALGVIEADELRDTTSEASADVFILFSFLGAALVYEAALTALTGKTLGKLITRSKTISTANHRPPGLGAAMVRVAVWLLPVLLLDAIGLVISGLVFAWAFFDRKGQGLHDKIANTYVVVDHRGNA